MSLNRPAIPFIALALIAASCAGCSRNKSISRDEARSEIRSARSFAAESEMFIEFDLQGHATRRYAEEHTSYLQDAVEQSAKELDRAVPEPGAEHYVRECQTKLRMLSHELSGIRAAIVHGDRDALAVARGRVGQIRKSLERVNSSL
jgi:hypothetical protein